MLIARPWPVDEALEFLETGLNRSTSSRLDIEADDVRAGPFGGDRFVYLR
jgi:hypothetical protein